MRIFKAYPAFLTQGVAMQILKNYLFRLILVIFWSHHTFLTEKLEINKTIQIISVLKPVMFLGGLETGTILFQLFCIDCASDNFLLPTVKTGSCCLSTSSGPVEAELPMHCVSLPLNIISLIISRHSKMHPYTEGLLSQRDEAFCECLQLPAFLNYFLSPLFWQQHMFLSC